MRYKIMVGGQKYKTFFSDSYSYHPVDPDRDVIEYTVLWSQGAANAKITATIKNPSNHTLYLIQQGRCYLWLNRRMTKAWSLYNNNLSGRRKGQRLNHPRWVRDKSCYVKVTSVTNNITLNFPVNEELSPSIDWINACADSYGEPERDEYYVEFKPMLVSAPSNIIDIINPNVRPYSTNAEVTTLTIQR